MPPSNGYSEKTKAGKWKFFIVWPGLHWAGLGWAGQPQNRSTSLISLSTLKLKNVRVERPPSLEIHFHRSSSAAPRLRHQGPPSRGRHRRQPRQRARKSLTREPDDFPPPPGPAGPQGAENSQRTSGIGGKIKMSFLSGEMGCRPFSQWRTPLLRWLVPAARGRLNYVITAFLLSSNGDAGKRGNSRVRSVRNGYSARREARGGRSEDTIFHRRASRGRALARTSGN